MLAAKHVSKTSKMNSKGSINRRQFIQVTGYAGLIMAFAGCSAYRKSTAGISGLYKRLNTDKYLGVVRIEARIQDNKVFTEGPAADPDGNIYFTNVPESKILKWDVKKNGHTCYFSKGETTGFPGNA